MLGLIKRKMNNLLKKNGFQVIKYPDSDLQRRIKLIKYFKINKIFDVGANIGQYASLTRKLGYGGQIFSFEPIAAAYTELKTVSEADGQWETANFALGDFDGETKINIAKNNTQSSLLPFRSDFAEKTFSHIESINIKRLDSIFETYYKPDDNIFLKIDAQGFEGRILHGGEKFLDLVTGIQLELSLLPSYDGVEPYEDLVNYLKGFGFSIFSIEPGHTDENGRLMEFDAIFFKEKNI